MAALLMASVPASAIASERRDMSSLLGLDFFMMLSPGSLRFNGKAVPNYMYGAQWIVRWSSHIQDLLDGFGYVFFKLC
jgi:hypothetical protein